MPDLVGRVYRINAAAGKTVSEAEALATSGTATIERIKRRGKLIGVEAATILQSDDLVLIVGRRSGIVGLEERLGAEVVGAEGLELVVTTRDIVVRGAEFADRSVAQILDVSKDLRHGIYVLAVTRGGTKLDITNDTVIKAGDIVTVHGVQEDLQRLASRVGPPIIPSDKTDFVFHGLGVAVGLLVGLAVVRLGSIPLTLGSGGGALMAGLVFGWYRGRHMTMGNMPTGVTTRKWRICPTFKNVSGIQVGLTV
ncbi:TrkA C-terminal domain-containing protein, partial [Rhizobium sp. YJ-22]|uniref:TrkA C-terminal domain-containing protein n=1 Tax=Rhizobium sp. YJ-22 TaxID=3037556 RepID=UPI002412C9E7